jgi:hypothetical protein
MVDSLYEYYIARCPLSETRVIHTALRKLDTFLSSRVKEDEFLVPSNGLH